MPVLGGKHIDFFVKVCIGRRCVNGNIYLGERGEVKREEGRGHIMSGYPICLWLQSNQVLLINNS